MFEAIRFCLSVYLAMALIVGAFLLAALNFMKKTDLTPPELERILERASLREIIALEMLRWPYALYGFARGFLSAALKNR